MRRFIPCWSAKTIDIHWNESLFIASRECCLIALRAIRQHWLRVIALCARISARMAFACAGGHAPRRGFNFVGNAESRSRSSGAIKDEVADLAGLNGASRQDVSLPRSLRCGFGSKAVPALA